MARGTEAEWGNRASVTVKPVKPMTLAERPAEPLGLFGRQDEMHVVGHQAIASHRHPLPRAGLAGESTERFMRRWRRRGRFRPMRRLCGACAANPCFCGFSAR